jgi:hypothetical protein
MEQPEDVWSLWEPESEADKQAIREQLEKVLADPHFKNSRRYPSLLRYVVEKKLSGHSDQLKERNLGVEVFGREPEYDTNMEPVVRTTAVEVRKRLTQYYQDPARHSEIRIDLPAGSYVPEFHHMPKGRTSSPAPGRLPPRSANRNKLWYWLGGILVIGILTIGVLRFRTSTHPGALDRFWTPMLRGSGTVLFCIGGPRPDEVGVTGTDSTGPSVSAYQILRLEFVALADSITLSRITGLLTGKGKPYRIRSHNGTSFADLRNTPVILIGAFNNSWSMQFNRPLRFTFELEHTDGPEGGRVIDVIRDKQNLTREEWEVEPTQPYNKVTEDYAIISRTFDPNTQGIVVTVGGLLKWGTVAAGEFLSEPQYIEDASRLWPGDWDQKNIEIVIGTKVFQGNSAPPRVLAAHFW